MAIRHRIRRAPRPRLRSRFIFSNRLAQPRAARNAALLAAVLAFVLFGLGHGLASPGEALAAIMPGGGAGDAGVLPMPFEKPGESFPGAAYYYLSADPAAPVGSDGSAHWDNEEPASTGPAANALMITGGLDRSRALTCLTTAIYYEAATEPDDGQRAVAQVVLNRVAHPAFPKTVCGVVYQGSERATGCQFTFTCDGSLARRPSPSFWARAEGVARAALGGYVYAPIGLATHYHTFAVHPAWDASMDFIMQIGAHRFYRLLGQAGGAVLFRTAYRGGEPLPVPHPRAYIPAPLDAATDPLAIERAYAAGLASAEATATRTALPARGEAAIRADADPRYRMTREPGAGASFAPGPFIDGRSPPADTGTPALRASGTWIAQPD